jgi:preprotein translocase subunit SecA
MPGRRWSTACTRPSKPRKASRSSGNQTLATITFQNYFRMYKKLAGMTGTAETEAAEFDKIYKLDVVVIPTNKQMLRIENPDVVYRTEKEKYFAVADEIQKLHEERPAGARRHHVDRKIRAPLRHCSSARASSTSC